MKFFKPTFDSITKGLRRTITRLEKLMETNTQAAADIAQAIADEQTQIETLNNERGRAALTASKLRELIG